MMRQDEVSEAQASAWVRAGQEALRRGEVLAAFVWFERVMRDYNHLEQAETAAQGLLEAERLAPAALEDTRLNKRLMCMLAACSVVLGLAMAGVSWTAWRTNDTLSKTSAVLATARVEGAAWKEARDEALMAAAQARAETQRKYAELAAHQLSAEYMYQRAVLAEAPADGELKQLDALEAADAEARRLLAQVESLHPDSPWAHHARERLELLGLRKSAREEALKRAQRPFEAKLKQCRALRNKIIAVQREGIPVNPYTGEMLLGFAEDRNRRETLVTLDLMASMREAKLLLDALPDERGALALRLRTTCQEGRLGETLVEPF